MAVRRICSMKRRLKRACAAIVAAAGLTFVCVEPAEAFSDGAAQQEKEREAEAAGPLKEEAPDEAESTPFSMPGNGKLVDDVEDDGTAKQFLSVQTKNGNTFYIVVDRSGNSENVYMLSLVDENDLAEFIEADSEEEPDVEESKPPVLDLETSADTEAEDGQDDEDKKAEKSAGMGAALPVLLALGCGAAGLYYFQVLKPGKEADTKEDEPLEFFSEYENGQEDGDGNEE